MGKVYDNKTLFIESSLEGDGNYVFITKDPMARNAIRRSLIRAMKGYVKHPTGTSNSFKLKSGGVVTVLVHPTKVIPNWLKYDAVYFDRSFD